MGKELYTREEFAKIEETGDYISVYDFNGVKTIKFWGYLYTNGDGGFDKDGNPDETLTWRRLEYTGVEMPLAEFTEKKFEEITAEYTQYIGDITEEDAFDYANRWFERVSLPAQYGDVQRIDAITADLACGLYIW